MPFSLKSMFVTLRLKNALPVLKKSTSGVVNVTPKLMGA